MRKRILLTLSFILSLFFIVSCNTAGSHNHSLNDGYSYNEEYHWRTCKSCNEKIDKVEHDFQIIDGPTDFILYECSCGYSYREDITEHIHSMIHHTSNDPTCMLEGNIEYYECNLCFKLYSDIEGANELNEEDVILSSLGHDGSFVEGKSATCFKEGTKEHFECTRCHLLFEDSECLEEVNDDELVLPMKEHEYGSLILGSENTCVNSGTINHYECSVCHKLFNEEKIEVSSVVIDADSSKHSYISKEGKPSTCMVQGYTSYQECEYCSNIIGKENLPLSGHLYTSFSKETPATCLSDGIISYCSCSVCDKLFNTSFEEVKSTIIPKSDEYHDWKSVQGTPATCTTTGISSYSECSICHSIKDKATIPTIDHTFSIHVDAVNPTCIKDGNIEYSYCSMCQQYFDKDFKVVNSNQLVILKSSEYHSYKTIKGLDPTCVTDGYSSYQQCEYCSNIIGKETIKALGHSISYISATDPTCDEEGCIAHYECSRCQKAFTDASGKTPFSGEYKISKLSHSMTHFEAKEATCEIEGNIEYYQCENCLNCYSDIEGNNYIEDPIIPALGHNYLGEQYQLVSSTSKLSDGDTIVFVYNLDNKYYVVDTSRQGQLINISSSKFNPVDNIQEFEVNSSIVSGAKSLYVKNGFLTNKYLGSSTAYTSYTGYDDCTSKNSTKWTITISSNLASLKADGTNAYCYLGYSTSKGLFGAVKSYSTTDLKLYIYKKIMNDKSTVRLSDGTYGSFYTCPRCNRNFDESGVKVNVTSVYNLLKKGESIDVGDEVVLFNQNYQYTIKAGTSCTIISMNGKFAKENITSMSNVQTFKIYRGNKNNSFRYHYESNDDDGDEIGFLYIKLASDGYKLIGTTDLVTSMAHGSFTFNFIDGYSARGTMIADTSNMYRYVYGTADTFYCNSSANNPYEYASRYMSMFRQEYTITRGVTDLESSNPTCEDIGMKPHYYDSIDNLYFDENHHNVSYESLVIPVLGHNYDYEHPEHVFGTWTHQFCCLNDPTHIIVEPCTFNKSGICTKCGANKTTDHLHSFIVKAVKADALVDEKTCSSYETYIYTCSCGAIDPDVSHTWENVDGGMLDHTMVYNETKDVTCTTDGYINKTYCKVCGYIESVDSTSKALGHDWDNGDFEFDYNAYEKAAISTGKWTYVCERCGTKKTEKGDMTTRPGSSDYAYKQLSKDLHYDGSRLHLGSTHGRYINATSMVTLAQYFYKEMFLACEDFLDSDVDLSDRYFCDFVTPKFNLSALPDGITNSEVGSFFMHILTWFKSDHPEYYFVNADAWSYGSTNYKTNGVVVAKKFSYSAATYKPFYTAKKRNYYNEEFEKKVSYYQDKYISIKDERLRAIAIFDEIMDVIDYEYGPSDNPDHSGNAVAPNTIVPLIDGLGVCESYALSFCYICRMNGIEAHELGSETHAWVYCRISNNWYVLDPTWADGGNVNKWFGYNVLNSDEDHTICSYWFPIPDVASRRLSYY